MSAQPPHPPRDDDPAQAGQDDPGPASECRPGSDADEPGPTYPSQWEADVVLRDGSVAHVRPIRPQDADAIQTFHRRQSPESIYLRFFAPLKELPAKDLHRFTHVDHHDRVALVVTLRDEIIGIGRFDRVGAGASAAEVAFNISDHYQGKGIGSVLLEHLAAIGQELGITRFVAEVLPQNRKMLAVFRDAGYAVSHRFEDGVVAVEFDIEPTERSRGVQLAREHRAESLSLNAVLRPASVAVIGASRRAGTVGHEILRNILDAGFTGPVHVVNPGGGEILGRPAVPRIADIAGGVDLAVIAVPAAGVPALVDECAAAGVRALLVVSAGFAEAGPDGAALQDVVRRAARAGGMRVLGPNSFGVVNTDPQVRLNASLASPLPARGGFGLFSQSGAFGIAVLAAAARRGLGISVFASAGNRVDVSGNDLMQYWIDDSDTAVVGLYLESMGNPRKFSRIARQLARSKPVIVVKSGISGHGVPPGHRTRETAVPQEAFDAMLRQAGVIRADNLHQLFDAAQLLVHQPLPRGPRVAVVTNSAALGAITADAARARSLEVTHGPVALDPEAGADDFASALRRAFADPQVDAVVTAFVPPLATEDADVAYAVRDASATSEKPCIATFLGMHGLEEALASGDPEDVGRRIVPAYPMPEDGVRALAAATRYAQWLARDPGAPVDPADIDDQGASELLARVLESAPEGRALTGDETERLLACYGIRLWPRRVVTSPAQAAAAAASLGYPVILKTTAPALRHQPGLTGVRADLAGPEAVHEAYDGLSQRISHVGRGEVIVQRMAEPGISCVLSATEDPLFGPVVTFSVAGPPTELFADIGYKIPPLTTGDIEDLLTSIRSAPLLDGWRGTAPADRATLADLVARVSVLSDSHPEIASLVLNPVNAWAGGVDILGAEVDVLPPQVRKDAGRRAMT